SLREIVISFHGLYWGKNFFAVYAHLGSCADENRRFQQRAAALASAEQFGPGGDRLLIPFGGAFGIGLADEWPKIGGFVLRVADFQLRDTLKKVLQEFVIDTAMNQDPLHRDAALSGVGESAGDAALGGEIEIGIGMNNDAGIAAKLQRHALLARFALELPAGGGAASKGQHGEPLIADEWR